MSLMDTLKNSDVPPGHMALCWLGQASFLIASPGGSIIALDPYLTNSCKEPAERAGFNMDRKFPSPVQPSELRVAAIAFTHSHADHCDPATIEGYRNAGGNGPYIATGETMEKLINCGVPREAVLLTWPNKEHRIDDIVLRATFAIPYGNNDLTHVGYLMKVDQGPAVYFTGDTEYHDVLTGVAEHNPDIMVTVINGAFRNMGPSDAAKLTQRVNPKLVVPCHYDLFPDNSLDPRLFRTCLHSVGISDKYLPLEHGQIFIYPPN